MSERNLNIYCLILFVFVLSSCNDKKNTFKECEELILSRSDYRSALKLYLECFNIYNRNKLYVSTRHINNALICAVEEEDNEIIEILSYEMKNRRADKEYFQRLNINLRNNYSNFKSLNFVSYKNLKLRDEIDAMYLLDQKFRESGTFDSLGYADSINYHKLKIILNRYGYPTEELVGSFINNGYLVSNPVEIIILHNLQQNNKELAIKLLESFLKDEIDEFVFSKYYSYGYTMNIKGYQDGFLFCRLYDIPILDFDGEIYQVNCPNDLPGIDSLRLKLNMDTYQKMLKKVSLRLCKQFHFYEPVPYIIRYSGGGEDILINDSENLLKLECNL